MDYLYFDTHCIVMFGEVRFANDLRNRSFATRQLVANQKAAFQLFSFIATSEQE